MYSVSADAARHRVLIVFEGEMKEDQAQMFSQLQEAVSKVKSAEGHFDLLADFSKAQVMSQESANDSQQVVEWCVANGLRKSANIMKTIIQRMQVERLSERDEKFAYFTTRAEAEEWLNS